MIKWILRSLFLAFIGHQAKQTACSIGAKEAAQKTHAEFGWTEMVHLI